MENNKETLTRLSSLESEVQSAVKLLVYLHETHKDSFEKVDKNFELIENRLRSIELKIDNLSHDSTAEFKSVGGKIDELKTEVMKIQKVSNYSEEYDNLLKIAK